MAVCGCLHPLEDALRALLYCYSVPEKQRAGNDVRFKQGDKVAGTKNYSHFTSANFSSTEVLPLKVF